LDERRSYWSWAASSALHGALLAFLLFGFASAPKFEDSPESIPVETVTQTELNQIMNGEKDARPTPEPPPAPSPAPPVAPPDLRASEEPTPTPPPKPEPPKPEPPKPEPPPPPPKPAPPPPPKPTAEDGPEPPARPKVVETPPERPKEPQEKPKPDAPQPKPTHPYDPNAIAKLIGQSKPSAPSAAPTATAATSATPQGLPHHDAPRMSVSMASALDAWLTESYLNCWTPPPMMPEGDVYVAQIKVVLNVDGSLSARPVLINPPTDPAWRAHAESAMRAVKKCDPLHVPPQYAPYFDQWKVETIHFDPRETQG
jgi:outer membrane biosynthesis protein TonB